MQLCGLWSLGRRKAWAILCGGPPLTFIFGTELGTQDQVMKILLIFSAARSVQREWQATFFSSTILGKGQQNLQAAAILLVNSWLFHLECMFRACAPFPISPSLTLALLSGTKKYWQFPLQPVQISWGTVKAHGTTVPLLLHSEEPILDHQEESLHALSYVPQYLSLDS